MQILFVTARNPQFWTITEYIERALRSYGHEVNWFDDGDFLFPGTFRDACRPVRRFDIWNLNRRLRVRLRNRPDLLLCAGGERLSFRTIETARALGIRTVMWTIDTIKPFDHRISLAPYFRAVFCGGTEMIEALRGSKIEQGPFWLPFACDPEIHCPAQLSSQEKAHFGCDIAFVGSLHPELYPARINMLTALTPFDLGIWGPGASRLRARSPLRANVRGDETTPNEWTRIYSSAKIILCAHYDGPGPECRQASPRVFEALACGGFLVCDNQPDVTALFEDGQDLVIYKSLEDLREKVMYYLAHDQERHAIAANGQHKVLTAHTYRHRVARMLELLSEATDAAEGHSHR